MSKRVFKREFTLPFYNEEGFIVDWRCCAEYHYFNHLEDAVRDVFRGRNSQTEFKIFASSIGKYDRNRVYSFHEEVPIFVLSGYCKYEENIQELKKINEIYANLWEKNID